LVLENIFRFIEEKKMKPFRRGARGDGGNRLAVMAHVQPLVIFVRCRSCRASRPVLFQFGITAAVAVLVSLLVSFTLTR